MRQWMKLLTAVSFATMGIGSVTVFAALGSEMTWFGDNVTQEAVGQMMVMNIKLPIQNDVSTGTGQSAYDKIAISRVSGYVNVRTAPNTTSAIVGKLYNNCAATILATVDGEGGAWYQIQSGTVNGYVKAQYFITGAEAEKMAKQIGTTYATINTESLRLREKPDLNSATLTTLSEGAHYVVVAEEGEFFKLAIDTDLTGYVFRDYIKTNIEFSQAVSLKEEEAKLAENARRKQDATAAIEMLAEVRLVEAKGQTTETKPADQASGTVTSPVAPKQEGNAGGTKNPAETKAPSSSTTEGGSQSTVKPVNPDSMTVASATRTAIIAYAKQFLGNPYVYGGTSLTNGADCSGFTQGVFSHFDIKTGRSSRDQAAKGREISISAIQPGDLLFYASGSYINHVALYIGGNQVIHSSNERTGIIISPYNYRTPCKAVTFLD